MPDDELLYEDDLGVDLSKAILLPDESELGFEITGLKVERTRPSEKNPEGFRTMRLTLTVIKDEDGKSYGRKHFQGFPLEGSQAFSTMNLLVCLGLATREDEAPQVAGRDLLGRRFLGYVQHRTINEGKENEREQAEIRRFIEPLN